MKNFIAVAAILALISLWSCSDDKNHDHTLELSLNTLEIYEELSYGDVRINRGSGEYQLTVEDASVLDAVIITREDYPYGAVRITGKKAGVSKVTVKDTGFNKSRVIEVRVTEPSLEIDFRQINPVVIADDRKEIEKELEEAMEGCFTFEYAGIYYLSREPKGIMYYTENSSIRGEKRFRHVWEDDQLYIIIRDKDDKDEAEARRLKIVMEENTGFFIYVDFFGMAPATRMAMPNDYRITYEEDFTDGFRERYPDAGVEKVAVTYVGKINFAPFKESTAATIKR